MRNGLRARRVTRGSRRGERSESPENGSFTKVGVGPQIQLDDTITVCIPDSHTRSVDPKNDGGYVQRTLGQLVDFSVSILLVVSAAGASGYYCMLNCT